MKGEMRLKVCLGLLLSKKIEGGLAAKLSLNKAGAAMRTQSFWPAPVNESLRAFIFCCYLPGLEYFQSPQWV